jgi:hypothetical protein
MPKRAIVVAVTAALVIVGIADAATPRTHTLNLTIQSAVLASHGTPPLSGDQTQVGVIHGSFGAGAGPAMLTFPAPGHASLTFTWFFAKGSFKGTATTVGKLNPDGSASITGSGKVSGGTGAYRGAKGTFTLTSTVPKGSTVNTLKAVGKVKF